MARITLESYLNQIKAIYLDATRKVAEADEKYRQLGNEASRISSSGDYTREGKEDSRRYGFIGGIYWCLVTAAYLAWSFIGNNWNISWIIWPIAGVAFGAVVGISKALRRN